MKATKAWPKMTEAQTLPTTKEEQDLILKCRNGFTLIELLLVISLMAILSAVGIPAFNTFSKNQTLKNAASELKENLRFAQNKALSGDKGTCTGTLVGWYGKFVRDETSYQTINRCKVSGTEQDSDIKTYSLPQGIKIKNTLLSPTVYVLFGTVNLGSSFHNGLPFFNSNNQRINEISNEPLEITLTNNSNCYTVYINRAGKIYEQETACQ